MTTNISTSKSITAALLLLAPSLDNDALLPSSFRNSVTEPPAATLRIDSIPAQFPDLSAWTFNSPNIPQSDAVKNTAVKDHAAVAAADKHATNTVTAAPLNRTNAGAVNQEQEKSYFQLAREGLRESIVKVTIEHTVETLFLVAIAAWCAWKTARSGAESSKLSSVLHQVRRNGPDAVRPHYEVVGNSIVCGDLNDLLTNESQAKAVEKRLSYADEKISLAYFPRYEHPLLNDLAHTQFQEISAGPLHSPAVYALRGGFIQTLLSAYQSGKRSMLVGISSGDKERGNHNLVLVSSTELFYLLDNPPAFFRSVQNDPNSLKQFIAKFEAVALTSRKMEDKLSALLSEVRPDITVRERRALLENGRRLGAILTMDHNESMRFIEENSASRELPALDRAMEKKIENQISSREKKSSRFEHALERAAAPYNEYRNRSGQLIKSFVRHPLDTWRKMSAATLPDEEVHDQNHSGWVYIAALEPLAPEGLRPDQLNFAPWVHELIENRASIELKKGALGDVSLENRGRLENSIARKVGEYFNNLASQGVGNVHFLTECTLEDYALDLLQQLYNKRTAHHPRPPLFQTLDRAVA